MIEIRNVEIVDAMRTVGVGRCVVLISPVTTNGQTGSDDPYADERHGDGTGELLFVGGAVH